MVSVTRRSRVSTMLVPAAAFLVIVTVWLAMRGTTGPGATPPQPAPDSRPIAVDDRRIPEPAVDPAPEAARTAEISVERESVLADSDAVFTATVQDDRGDPVPGVSITLRLDASHVDVRADTNAQGEARFTRRSLSTMLEQADADSQFIVYATVRHTEPDRFALSRSEFEGGRKTFEVEARASVEVEVTCRGKPFGKPVKVDIGRVAKGMGGEKPSRFNIASAMTDSGKVRFAGIEPGAGVIATATYDDAVADSDLSQPATLTLSYTSKLRVDITPIPHLRMRLVDASGAPLDASDVAIRRYRTSEDGSRATDDSPDLDLRRLHTLADGSLRIPLDGAPAKNRKDWVLIDHERGPDRLAATLEVSSHLACDGDEDASDRDAGDVVMREAEKIAAGIVLQPNGVPCSGAMIRLGYDDRDKPFDPSRPRMLVASSGRDGAFAIYGYDTESSFHLVASGMRFAESAALACAKKAEGIVLVLRSLGRIEGTIALPRPLASSARLHLERRETKVPAGDGVFSFDSTTGPRDEWVRRAGAFSVGELAPGTWDLSLEVSGMGVVAEVKEIVVAVDAVTRDARLLDLGAGVAFDPITISTFDAATGDPVAAWVRVIDARTGAFGPTSISPRFGSKGPSDTHEFQVVVDRQRGATILVNADGYAGAALEGVTESRKVLLERIGSRRILLSPWPQAARRRVWLRLVPLGDDGKEKSGEIYRSDVLVAQILSDGTADLTEVRVGRFRVHFSPSAFPQPIEATDATTDVTIPGGLGSIDVSLSTPAAVVTALGEKR